MGHKQYSYEELLEIVAVLRGENGCPWDRAQTHDSMKPCLIEECYEVLEAIDRRDDENLKEELGDVLLQVLLHTQIASEEGRFTMTDVIQELSQKLIRRHPHVFQEKKAETAEEGLQNWEEVKMAEKKDKPLPEGPRDVPKAFPALIRAQKVQKKAAQNDLSPASVSQEYHTLYGILRELENACKNPEKDELDSISGELLFKVVNLIRILGLNAENSLTNATETFINKFEGEMDKH